MIVRDVVSYSDSPALHIQSCGGVGRY